MSGTGKVLPEGIVARLDWDTLATAPGSFVDEELKNRHSDILFEVHCGGRAAFVYVLFEHQSEPQKLMPFRMLEYMAKIWGAFLRNSPESQKLPAILPVVVHHGNSGWTAATELREIVDLDAEMFELADEYLPTFRFVLDDLARIDEQVLFDRTVTALARAALLLMRTARSRSREELLGDLGRWTETLREVFHAPGGAAAFWALMRYILLVTELPAEELQAFAQRLGPKAA